MPCIFQRPKRSRNSMIFRGASWSRIYTACWFTPSSHIRLAVVVFSHDFSYPSVFSKEHVLQVTVPLTKLLSFTGSNWWIKKWRFPNPKCWSVSVSKSHFTVYLLAFLSYQYLKRPLPRHPKTMVPNESLLITRIARWFQPDDKRWEFSSQLGVNWCGQMAQQLTAKWWYDR